MSLLIDTSFLWNETVWNPSMISTALWLDAADNTTVFSDAGTTQAVAGSSTVQQWNDKSGNARHATQSTSGNRPSYTSASVNGRNVLTFNGSTNFLSLATAIEITDNNTFVFSVFGRATSGINSVDVGRTATPPSYAHWWFTDNVLYSLLRPTSSYTTSYGVHGSASTATGTFINGLVRDNSGTQAWRNGSTLGTAQVSANASNHSYNAVGRAQGFESSVGFHNGTIAEVIVGRTTITTDTRQRIEGYLAHKWGLGANLPNDHPYKTVGPKP